MASTTPVLSVIRHYLLGDMNHATGRNLDFSNII
jgi:hypothetical protein